MAVSKRLRYEVLSRDGFACRYCGAEAPDAKLVVDHVMPVALGGSDKPDNLVTACFDCNAGKSSASPDAQVVADVDCDALRWGAAMKRAAEIQAQQVAEFDAFVAWFDELWGRYYTLPRDFRTSLERWWRAGVSRDVIADCVDIAMRAPAIDYRWKYFCGVLNRRLREQSEIATELFKDGDA